MTTTLFRRLLSLYPGRPLRRPVLLAVAAVGALALLLWLGHLAESPRPSSIRPVPFGTVQGTAGPREGTKPDGVLDRTTWRPAAAPVPEAAAPWGRRIIRQATVDVELDDVDRAIARLTDLVEAAGGYVADTQVHSDASGIARATVTAYVPTTAFGRALGDLERLGHMGGRRITGQDVSEEFVDLEARIRNLERHEGQLLSFMGKAQKVADLVSLESELARVRGEIERFTGRLRFLRARTEMASIQVSLIRGVAPTSPDRGWVRSWERVRKAFVAGWKAAFDAAVGLAAAAARLSPLALPAALGWALYRRFRRQPVMPPPPATT